MDGNMAKQESTHAEFVEAIVRFFMLDRALLHAGIAEVTPGHVWDNAFMVWLADGCEAS